jgi:FKBP-type peptidyl-prolyl cis-trans isomerase
MKMNRWTGMLVAMIAFFASCTGKKDFSVTKTGLGYKIYSGGGKDKLKRGGFVRYSVVQTIEDSLLTVPGETPDQFAKVDTVSREFDIWEIADKLFIGDSVAYRLPVDTIYSRNAGANPASFPPFLKKGKNIYVYIKLLKQYDSVQAVDKDYQAEMMKLQETLAAKRKAEMEKLVKEKFTGAVKTNGGTYVMIKQQGDGPQADTGKMVSMMYEGRFVDGKVFDGNLNQKDTALRKPIEFKVMSGLGGVIQGWVEALPLLKKGAKASFLIPYDQAYGTSGWQSIPPYSNLIFDVEVVDVKDAPAHSKPVVTPR